MDDSATRRKHVGDSSPGNQLVPASRTDLAIGFDPEHPSTLISRGMDRLRQLSEPSQTIDERVDEIGTRQVSGAITTLAKRLASSMLDEPDLLVGSARSQFTAEQRAVSWACLYVCANAAEPPSPAALNRLGAVTDLVADEQRFWWWSALPLRVAINVAGEGNGGYRTLYGNLAHPDDALRRELIQLAWLTRRHLTVKHVAAPLLHNVETTAALWPASLALLRDIVGAHQVFLEIVRTYVPAQFAARYRGRIAGLDEPDGPLCRYLDQPTDLLASEDGIGKHAMFILDAHGE